MSSLILDTHAVIWYLANSSRLSDNAKNSITATEKSGDLLYISIISLIEMLYLEEKGRISSGAVALLKDEVYAPDNALTLTPIGQGVVDNMTSIPRKNVPDMPDRIIAATALFLGCPLVTRDHKIQSTSLDTIW